MKGKNSHVFLLKKVGGDALIMLGALNRDYTVLYNLKAESFSSLVSFVNKYTVLETICV